MTPQKNLYFIAIVFKDQEGELLNDLKLEFSEKYGARHALNSPPHITLHMPFKWRDDREEFLIKTLSEVNAGPINVKLSNFKSFPPRVIYVDLDLSEELNFLYKEVHKTAREGLKISNADYKNRGFTPHVTIAHRDLSKQKFYEAWEVYKTRDFSLEKRISEFSLLKHNGKKWEVFKDYSLS